MNDSFKKYIILDSLLKQKPIFNGDQTYLNPEILAQSLVDYPKESVFEAVNEYNAQISYLKIQELFPEESSFLDKEKVTAVMGQDPFLDVAIEKYNANIIVNKQIKKSEENVNAQFDANSTLLNSEIISESYGVEKGVANRAANEYNSIIVEKKLEERDPIEDENQTHVNYAFVAKTYNVSDEIAYLSAKKYNEKIMKLNEKTL